MDRAERVSSNRAPGGGHEHGSARSARASVALLRRTKYFHQLCENLLNIDRPVVAKPSEVCGESGTIEGLAAFAEQDHPRRAAARFTDLREDALGVLEVRVEDDRERTLVANAHPDQAGRHIDDGIVSGAKGRLEPVGLGRSVTEEHLMEQRAAAPHAFGWLFLLVLVQAKILLTRLR
jgi:hypothetical protein